MPGVLRAYTLIDVLQTIYGQANAASQNLTGSVPGIGVVTEVDETLTSAEAVATYVTTPQGWDQQAWGAIGWG